VLFRFCATVSLETRWNIAKSQTHNFLEYVWVDILYQEETHHEKRRIYLSSLLAIVGGLLIIALICAATIFLVFDDSKGSCIPSNGVFKVFGKAMTAEELGNFNFGFTGTIVGFADSMLHWGAGIVAIKNNGVNWSDWRYSFDSKEDYMIIQQGINMANYITYRGYSVEEALEIVWK